MSSFSYRNLINITTRVTSTSAKTIDHVLTNITSGMKAGVYDEAISDHLRVFVSINDTRKSSTPRITTEGKIDYNLLQSIILAIDPDSLYNDDVNVELQNLIKFLIRAIGNSRSNVSSRSYKTPLCPWMTAEILDLLKTKDFWYHK